MRDVLNRVGIKAVNAQGYQSQFGIALHVQKPVEIGGGIHALMAAPVSNDTAVPAGIVLAEPMQALLTEARNTLGFNNGEYTMFIAAQPDIPPSMPSVVMVAQANAFQATAKASEHILGVCDLVDSRTGQIELFPVGYANTYYFKTNKINTPTITILQQPKHGLLEPISSDGDWGDSRYRPNDGYIGDDSFVMQVEGNGYKVKLYYFVAVVADEAVTPLNPNPVCKGQTWKISQDANGTSTLTAVDYLPALTSDSTTVTISMGSDSIDIANLQKNRDEARFRHPHP